MILDNLLLEIRLARELFHLRGAAAFNIAPIFIGEYERAPPDDFARAKELDAVGFQAFDAFGALTGDPSDAGAAVAAVEARLAHVMKQLGMGSRPRTPAGVLDNLRWVQTFQGIVVEPDIPASVALTTVAARIKAVAMRVSEAPHKPTAVVLKELTGWGRGKKARGRYVEYDC